MATAVFCPFAVASGVRGGAYTELEKYTRLVIAHSVVWLYVMNEAACMGSVALYMSRAGLTPGLSGLCSVRVCSDHRGWGLD